MPKNLVLKKITHIKDELKLSGGGLYAFLCYDNLDKRGKGCFKIGYAINFNERAESYYTSHPLGLFFVAFLQNPLVRLTKTNTKKKAYGIIEKHIFDYMENNGGKRIVSTTRIKNIDDAFRGETEFFYCNVKLIHSAFRDANEKFGGMFHPFHLKNVVKTDAEPTDEILYTGEVEFHIDNVRTKKTV